MSERNIHETTLETKRLQGKEEKRGGGERGGGEREIITNFPWRLQIKHVKASVFNHKYRASSSCCCRQSSKHNFKPREILSDSGDEVFERTKRICA
ncbi:uncharacterized protein LOC112349295 isoform X4 [Selaginella moellendorffii]|uniref:uncharacterized protein LOC112349295 isoform X4 n=1 Tax=Selaginella moellendorffii TaxID=88036 RepID=UPI000D1CC4C5|nr:uncharacterized protein LOC112349295 isoform X4 [Selaginella moellendorffii]|eukprot:XP_024539274.1 uncharacterized protein LOC112349295 isoform X4 [Selaginella moellendorffii]